MGKGRAKLPIKQRIMVWFLAKRIGKELDKMDFWTKHRTTLLAFLASVTGVSTVGWFKQDGTPNYFAIVSGVALTLYGYFTKDKDITGGTVRVPTVDNPPTLPEPKGDEVSKLDVLPTTQDKP